MNEYNMDEEKILKQIKGGLDRLDKEMVVSTPDMNHFRQMVKEAEKRKELRRKKEFFVFFFLSLIILFVEIASYRQSMLTFVVIQAISALSIPGALVIRWIIKRRQVEV